MQIESTNTTCRALERTRRTTSLRTFISLTATTALLGCGAATPTASTTRTSTSAGSDASTHEAPRVATAFEGNATELPVPHDPSLHGRTAVPGTGVTMNVPAGAELTPVGAGFVSERDRFLIRVAVANGSRETLDQLVTSMRADAEEIATERITLEGRPARLVVDRQRHANLDLERVWIFAQEGQRALVAVGAYAANSPVEIRNAVRDTVLSTRWDPEEAVDPERAAGFGLTPPEGLAIEPQIANTLTYLAPGTELSPASGRPAMLVVPLPFDVPPTQRIEFCTRILPEAGPVGEDTVLARGEIATDTLQGCEVFGREEIPEPIEGGAQELATYAAIVFADDASFMVVGSVEASQRDTWAPRFAAATRTVSTVNR